ncbi:FtsW/RodA/SpoVE family cell cycle protein [Phocea massiliensis]|uniref:FtsW/RodA/SpoVE family cell cycle protein n=1 Tax=Merdimmobilis hominis TaxID=2897707 RepID=A0A938X510_9FIRM|nr:FtsW/RodA/SpoVE family cell cycle protein [Merdimmobilis hominis]MBM6919649.1 FtsW/RodA/SpoVE family cell cycle protein [Merdimmobilis hominis]
MGSKKQAEPAQCEGTPQGAANQYRLAGEEFMKGILNRVGEFLKTLDLITVFICLACSGISMACLLSFYSYGQRTAKVVIVQAAAILIGLVVALFLSKIDYNIMTKLWKMHAPLAVGLVLLTFVIGVAPNPNAPTDKAWLDLGVTTFQPSELLKLSFILTFSLHLSHVGGEINRPKNFLLLCLHAMAPFGLIVLQSDIGTAMVFMMIFVVMMFTAGLSWRLIAVGLIGAAAVVPVAWMYLPDFLKSRFLAAQNPELYLSGDGKGWQQYLGRIALGSGQLSGRGLFKQDSLYYVPEAHNDFIFSYIGQTMGFIGCLAALLLLTALCVKILLTARASKDTEGTLICCGVFAMLFFQIVVNIGMVLCIVPVVGVTLPFFSAGGTSAVVNYMAIGLVLSVYRKNKKTTTVF